MEINELSKELYEESKALFGENWSEGDPIVFYALMITELSEAIEESRKTELPVYFAANGKPEGQLVELADTVIRILNYCGSQGWDIEEAIRSKREYNNNKRKWKKEGKRV